MQNTVNDQPEKVINYEAAVDSDMDDIVVENEPKKSKTLSTIFDEYLDFKKLDIGIVYDNPLEFWSGSSYTLLKILAMSVFVTQASSSEPERHNSAAGLVMSPLRGSIAPQTLESLVLYNEYLKN